MVKGEVGSECQVFLFISTQKDLKELHVYHLEPLDWKKAFPRRVLESAYRVRLLRCKYTGAIQSTMRGRVGRRFERGARVT